MQTHHEDGPHGQNKGPGRAAEADLDTFGLILVLRLAEPVVTREQASIYLQAMYPGCGPKTRRKILKRFDKSTRRGRIGRVVGIVVENWVRHQRTPYDALIRGPHWHKIPRDRARKMVSAEVAAIAAEFRVGSAERDPGYLELKAQLRTRRAIEGTHSAITAAENEAIVAYLKEWLKQRRTNSVRASQPEGPG